jgi:hypothetical protein
MLQQLLAATGLERRVLFALPTEGGHGIDVPVDRATCKSLHIALY